MFGTPSQSQATPNRIEHHSQSKTINLAFSDHLQHLCSAGMLKPMKKLSVLGILSDSMILIHENSKLITFLFLLLFPFNSLTTAITALKPFSMKLDMASLLPFQLPRLPKYFTDEIGSLWEFEPVEYVLWWISATSGIYLLSIALLMKPGTLSELFFIAGRRFKQFIITSLYVHVFMVLDHVLLIGPIFLEQNSENEMPVSIAGMVLNAAGLVAFVFSNAASLSICSDCSAESLGAIAGGFWFC